MVLSEKAQRRAERRVRKRTRQQEDRVRNQAYYLANRDKIRSHIYESREPKREIRRQAIGWYLLSHPCADCGETDVDVLEFDHILDRGEKVCSPYNGRLLDGTLARLWAEIQKCDVVCANCHRRRSRSRGQFRHGGWYR